jgi:glycosidase
MAQFNTPTVDGVISPNEYGVHTNGQNQQSTGTGQTWYLTWDNANLYVAVTNANLAEGAVVAIDKNPVSPPNGGTNADGTLNALNYDSTTIGTMPFRADFRTYFKDGYRDYQTANGANGWNFGASGFGNYASGAGNVREFAIPWTVINGGARPASFLFSAYLSSGGGFIYGQVPQGNAGGNTPGNWSRYFAVVNTNDTTSTKPFSLDQTISTDTIQYLGLKHDTFDSYYRSPFGAVPTGSTVNLKFRTDLLDVSQVFLKVYQYNSQTGTTDPPVEYPLTFLENRTEGSTTYAIYSVNFVAPSTPSIIYYKFRAVDGTAQAFYSDAYNDDHDNLGQGGDGAATPGEPFPAFQLTVYSANFTTPSWLHNTAVYQIFPDRFRNGDITNDWCRTGNTTGCPNLYGNPTSANIVQTTWNTQMVDPRATANNNAYGSQFYGGDLNGIENKLDYIKNLGFDTIYLTPIFAARSNHGYDADNYLQIAPQLGGDAAFTSLKNAADARGMKIILDGVWNHVSQDSLYMDYYNRYPTQGGCESFTSPYRSWFTWNATATTVPCVWTHYNGWFGFGGLPELTEGNEIKDFIYRTPTTNVTQYWFDRGASGWRFDVADNISHNWWIDYRPFAKSYKSDAPLIGEIWYDSSMYLLGDQLDSVMNYRFRKNVLGFARSVDWEDNDNSGNNKIVGLTPSQFNRAMLAIREDYPLPAQLAMLNLLDSHDTNRALYTLTVLGDSGLTEAKQRLKLAATFQFTYLGAPMVYYGDEAGINSPSVANSPGGLPEDDPYNRAPYPWSDETGNTAVYGPADNSLISYYTILGTLRKQNAALRTGSFETLLMGDITASTTDNNTFAFARQSGANKVVVVLNNGSTANTAVIPVGTYFTDGTTLTDSLGNSSFTDENSFAQHVVTGGNVTVTLAARTAAILVPFVPTAATANIAGRITLPNGAGLGRVNIEVQNINTGEIYKAQTDGSGYYRVEGRLVGNQYVVTPSRRLYSFTPKTELFTLLEDREDLNFTARRR